MTKELHLKLARTLWYLANKPHVFKEKRMAKELLSLRSLLDDYYCEEHEGCTPYFGPNEKFILEKKEK